MIDTATVPAKRKPGAWGSANTNADLPIACVSSTDPRVVRALDLVAREAELLDHKDYEAWQLLYLPEALYIIPTDPDETDFVNNLNMVYDDQRMRQLRVVRMTEGYSIASVDSARTIRTIGRVVPAEVLDSDSGSTVNLRVAQTLVAYKRGRHDIWAANVDFVISVGASPTDDRIAHKVVRLIDGNDEVPAAGFLL